MKSNADLGRYFGTVDYAVYSAYLDTGCQDKALFKKFSDNVMDAVLKTGTILIDNAPIISMKKRILDASQNFFGLPEDVRNNFAFPDYNERGYLPYGVKKAKDYKNMFHADDAVYKAMCGVDFAKIRNVHNADALQNITCIKDHVADFNDSVMEFTRRGNEMGGAFLDVLCDHFGASEQSADLKQGQSLLRLLHYMPFDKSKLQNIEGVTRASAHADISAMTFLLTSDQPGLQIVPQQTAWDHYGTTFISNAQMGQLPADSWINVPTGQDQCIMNIGRTLEIMSNGILSATPHQVVPVEGQEGAERFSVPFFYHLPWDMTLNIWQKAVSMRDGENYFAQKGDQDISLEDYVLRDHLRPSIEPNRPVPVYRPS